MPDHRQITPSEFNQADLNVKLEHSIQNEYKITAGDKYQNGRYTVIKELAEGGQGKVLLVTENNHVE
jgi:hypothetical protein